MSEETNTEAVEPTKKKTTRKKATQKKSGKRYFAFANPGTQLAVQDSYLGSIKTIHVNKWSVVVGLDPQEREDELTIAVIEGAMGSYNGRRGVNPTIKEVAADISDAEKNLIGKSKIEFNRQAYRKAFEGLKRI